MSTVVNEVIEKRKHLAFAKQDFEDTLKEVKAGDKSEPTMEKLSLKWEKCEAISKELEEKETKELVERAVNLADSISRITAIFQNVISTIDSFAFMKFNGLMDCQKREFEDVLDQLKDRKILDAEDAERVRIAVELVTTEKEEYKGTRRKMPCGGR